MCLDTTKASIRGESFFPLDQTQLKIRFIPCLEDPAVFPKTNCAKDPEF